MRLLKLAETAQQSIKGIPERVAAQKLGRASLRSSDGEAARQEHVARTNMRRSAACTIGPRHHRRAIATVSAMNAERAGCGPWMP